jgi:hypothetical protein
VLVYLYPLDLITLGILLGESYYNWHPYTCGLFYLAEGPPIVPKEQIPIEDLDAKEDLSSQ